MKKAILLLSAAVLTFGAANAQTTLKTAKSKINSKAASVSQVAKSNVKTATTAAQDVDSKIKFATDEHDFGTIPEGPAVSYDFMFTNTSKQPIQLEHVQASCGCTTPNWSKDPILPGKTSKITATYNTKGRPGNFYKTITVRSTAGTKTLKIKGVVEKAPTSSVPSNKSSMLKH